MNWRDFWNDDTPIYVSDRHKTLHYAGIARDIAALIPKHGAVVLDHGCGEALSADRVAARCEKLYLCDAAPLVRGRLAERFAGNEAIRVIEPDDVATLPDHSLDVVVANSVLQYLTPDEFDELLGLWRTKLKDDGHLILADVIPHTSRAIDDILALLRFAWRGGFLGAALMGLARTATSDYRRLRSELGLTQYEEEDIVGLLRDRGFEGARQPTNVGHNQARMTFVAHPV